MADEKLSTIRHSASHVMAAAVLQMFPDAKIAIGPSIENGFYYDFDLPRPLKMDDFPEIEERMRDIINKKQDFIRKEVSRAEALELFKDQPYKTELINDLPESEIISIYTVDKFTDLCRGPHVENTKMINPQAIKLLSIAGAYWRGDEKRPMLQRIYATAFTNPKDLRLYLQHLEELEKRDHRKIGKELDLFHIDDENPGQVFWHPKGWTIYRTLEDYVRAKIKADGYVEVRTPFCMPQSLWERSGHWAKYKKNMFITESEKRLFALKPMNCPGHVEIFKQGLKSYRDLPLRMAEFGSCTRNEPSGTLHGVMRVRGFVQDDAHIFCTEDQVPSEVAKFCHLLKDMYRDFGFTEDKIIVKFSTRPELRVGDDATWDRAEGALADACQKAGITYEIAPGEGAFYGPKLEFTLVDALGRQWQCGTIQVDFQLPSAERLNAEYIGEDNAKHHPVMLHRAVLGSLERFIGILLENFAGALPVWLAPEQVSVIPVAPAFNEYAAKVAETLKAAKIRTVLDDSEQRMNAKIRNAQGQKVPYMFIIGDKEAAEGGASIRLRTGKQMNGLTLDQAISFVQEKIANKEEI
ncbi:MAG: threonine--tRNA ligase [Spirochaetia bacterium]|nr:threonine--tRNA ligase [Spirochaetia bacterium]